MNAPYKTLLLAATVAAALAACGKKNAEEAAAPAAAPAAAEAAMPYKQTERFGTVRNIELIPVFAVPAKYSDYRHIEVSETTKEEFGKLPDSAFETYVKTWFTQAASTDKPDLTRLAAIVHPEVAEDANEFKKQEAADKLKTEFPANKEALKAVYGWQGEVLRIAGPDVSNGEYYLTIDTHGRKRGVSYRLGGHDYSLYYKPVFDTLGLSGGRHGEIELTMKVPIEKAKEIEALREGQTTFMRVYGKVKGLSDSPSVLRKDITEASLDLDVEGIEFGIKKDGQFKPLFFLDADQLKKAK